MGPYPAHSFISRYKGNFFTEHIFFIYFLL